ncbi:predicted protein [Nematostella vectensis]|uniref:RBPJ-interacting and tubulin-associated protein 1 n=1 Tax=Nematostella vectensis TaxID=45351 RepID=A7RSW9_NEMVE|nr:predicted protein [Nematostella vectensis]|eukprot:XP_001637596.1 predicted protein [Nematostella vectensis]
MSLHASMMSGKYSRARFTPSNVDESLFGDLKKTRDPDPVTEFDPPWVDNGKAKTKSPPKPLLFYTPNRPSSSRSSSRANSSSRSTPQRKYKPVKFTPSYVDENLFGDRNARRSNSPPPREFDPPWAKEEDNGRNNPILFDYSRKNLVFDDREVLTNRSGVSTPGSGRLRPGSTTREKSTSKPPWR